MDLDSHPRTRRTGRLNWVTLLITAACLLCASNASAASISGTVTASTDGLGLGEICINMYNPAAGIVPPVAQGVTDATGHYTVDSVPAGGYFVVYFHCPLSGTRQWVQQWWNGHPTFFGADTVTLAAADAVTGMDVTMHPGQAIAGTVTTSDGGTDTGVPFCAKVHDTTGTVVGIVPVDVGGTYTLNEPPGDYKVEASPCLLFNGAKSNYTQKWWNAKTNSTDADAVTLSDSAAQTGIDIELTPAAHISGHVIDAVSGDPLAGICVAVHDPSLFNPVPPDTVGTSTQTNASGDYTLGGLAPGNYIVQFFDCTTGTHAGVFYAGTADGTPNFFQAHKFTLAAGDDVTGIDAQLYPSAQMSGTATVGGSPVVGICVQATPSGGTGGQLVLTDSNGHWQMTMPAGTYTVHFFDCFHTANVFEQWYDGKTTGADADPITLAAGDSRTDIDAAMELGGTITGRVTDPDGNGLPNICISASATVDGRPFGSGTITDSTGHYTVPSLKTASDYIVGFGSCGQPRTWVFQFVHNVSVTAPDATPLDVVMQPAGFISGNVTDSHGDPVQGICVAVNDVGLNGFGGLGTTDVNGHYTIDGLAATNYKARFYDCRANPVFSEQWFNGVTDYANATEIDVTARQTHSGVDAVMKTGGSISGTVTDAGGPVSGICVDAYTFPDHYLGGGIAHATTDGDGKYQIKGLSTGDYYVNFKDCATGDHVSEWWDDSLNELSAQSVHVDEGVDRPDVDAELGQAGHISGNVTDSDGNAISGCGVFAFDQDPVGSDQTDANGDYSIGGIVAGDYHVYFACPGYPPIFYDGRLAGNVSVHVDAGSTTSDIDMRLHADAEIAGTVTDSNGDPVEGICVDAGGQSATTGADGTYLLTGLTTNSYDVVFSDCRTTPELLGTDVWTFALARYVTTGIDAQLQPIPPPETTITSGPDDSSYVNSTSATFEFSSDQDGSTFQCSLDGADPSDCDSGIQYTNLTEGSHTFSVAASNGGRTDATPDSRSWTVDVSAPSSQASSPLSQYTTSTPMTVNYTSSDNNGVTDVELWGKGPGDAQYNQLTDEQPDNGDGSGSLSVSPADGAWSFYTRAHDAAGNYEDAPSLADATTFVDTAAPTVTFTNPAGDGSTTFTLGQSGGAFHFSCDDNGGSGLATVGGCVGTPAYGTTLDTSTVGPHNVSVSTLDAAGNSGSGSSSYAVYWPFGGFLQPVATAFSNQKAGSTVPVKFSLHGNRGLNIITAKTVGTATCPGQAPPQTHLENATGNLTYDAKIDQYNFNWKTEAAWSNSCRRLTLRLSDTSQRSLDVKFSK